MKKIIFLIRALLLIGILYSPVVYSESAKPDKEFTNSLGMKFVYIKPGMFVMGSPDDEPGRYETEKQHQVTLTKGFYMQTTEVMQVHWKSIMGINPSRFKDCEQCPVENVSWNDVQEFIRKLNEKEGKDLYRLPTEAEWEYAARAGTSTPFSFGTCISSDQGNYNGNYPLKGCEKGRYIGKSSPAASFPPNPWGLYEMHGNVCEWCSDWYGDYPAGSVTDPKGSDSGTYRIIRGGSWDYFARGCRSANRIWIAPAFHSDYVGFRLLRALP